MAKKLEATSRVLVVDDEPDLLTLMQLTLTKLGLEVVTADSRQSAMAALDRQTYALCLTDMQLGDGTGLDVLAGIAERGLDLPCAVISCFSPHANPEKTVAIASGSLVPTIPSNKRTGFRLSVGSMGSINTSMTPLQPNPIPRF